MGFGGTRANLLEVGRDGGEREDLEAEDVDAMVRVVLHLVLLRLPLAGATGGGPLPDHEPSSHHRAVRLSLDPRGPLQRSPPVRKDAPRA